MGLISRKLCRLVLMFLTGFASLSIFFFLFQSPSSSLCTIFDSISSNIDEILLINPSANFLVFGDFNVHHKDWLTYSGGTDWPGELCYNFLSQIALLSWLTLLCVSQTVILMVLLFWTYVFPLAGVFVLLQWGQWLSLQWEILIMLLS